MKRRSDEFLLRTERLCLALPPVGLADEMAAYLARNQDHFAASAPRAALEGAHTRERCLPEIKAAHREFASDRALRLVMFEGDQPTGSIVGDCAFTAITRGAFQACYLGYRLDRQAVGRGLMHEALSAAIGYVFGELRLHRIMANYRPSNERSGLLLRRLGFKVEGFAQDYLFLDGAWRDHILTSLVNTGVSPDATGAAKPQAV
jgi:ribosomal-protein-alanine N-acetyltransferase